MRLDISNGNCFIKTFSTGHRPNWPRSRAGREIHVWPVRLDASECLIESFRAVLSPDEIDRVARFRVEHARRSYIATRLALRFLLARYLEEAPHAIRFRYGSKGKPELEVPAGIHFNVSHSGGLAMLAFSWDGEIGVDVERIYPMQDMLDIAERFFSAEEAADLRSLPVAERVDAFFRCWTRKEAYVKAVGDGLFIPLDSFRVTLRRGEPAEFIHFRNDAAAARRWTLMNLNVGTGYIAALAYSHRSRPIRLFSCFTPNQLFHFSGLRISLSAA
jgi:4'-phosphopantetheinyl transferase